MSTKNSPEGKGKTETTERLLTALAATRASLEAGIARYAREAMRGDTEKAKETKRRNDALRARFDAIKAKLPEVKMDLETGEYFLARDDQGREVFRVRVKRVELVDVYDVPAKSEKEAVAKAVALKEVKPVRWSVKPACGESISAGEH